MALRIISRRMCQLSNYRRLAPIASSCIQNMKFSFDDNSALSLKCEMRHFSSNASQQEIAYYEEIKDLPNHKEKLLIDVREPNELIETGKIPTSINMPLKEMLAIDFPKDQFLKLFNREKPVQETPLIFFCMIGKRSENASMISRQLGYKNVKNYKGSWLDWAKREGIDK